MFFDKMPNVFFSAWFWIGIAAVLIATFYFFGKPPQHRQPSEFYLKHKKPIRQITDGFLIIMLILNWIMVLYFSIAPSRSVPKNIPSVSIDYSLYLFLTMSIPRWAWSAIIIGMLSVFYLNLTKVKRIVLFFISLIPLPLMILTFIFMPSKKPEDIWLILRIGILSLAVCWLFNGSAIIFGKHFFYVAWRISKALRLTSGDHPDWW